MVEKEIRIPIKCLRTDRGGELNYAEFNDCCKQHGVKRQLTTTNTRVVKCKNCTMLNLVRAILTEKKIPKNFWPKAVIWAIHIFSRSPTLAIKDMTPEEAWSGVKPSVDYFRVSGCLGHVHIPDAKRNKLEDISVTCVLFGVSSKFKHYRMCDPTKNKIIVSRNVAFEEDREWD